MKLMILDGNSIINRAFYGVRLLSTKEGLYTNAIFGFLNILEKMRNEEQPDALCVAFDLPGKTFRHLRYEGYKATRHKMPEELAVQMPVLKRVLSAMNIPIYECQGWEADDVIGTVGRICAEDHWDCVIVTGDRDSLQLINDRVTVKLLITKPGQTTATNYTPQVFAAEYGMQPVRMVDLKSLMGDSSDNIPGVPGVGPKTASDLLHKYGTLDGVYGNLTPENMKGKLFEKLTNGKESAYLSYELATIQCDAPISFTPEDALCREPRRKELYDLFLRLEFFKLIERYGLAGAGKETAAEETLPAEQINIIVPQTLEEALKAIRDMEGLPAVSLSADEALDTLAVDDDANMTVFCRSELGEDMKPVLEALFSGMLRLNVHGAKHLIRRLLDRNLPAKGIVFDTEIAAYLLDASRGKFNLPRIALDHWKVTLPKAEDIDAPKELADRAVLESEATAISALRDILEEKLKERGCDKLYFETELPLCTVLAQMEHEGVLVDAEALQSFDRMLQERIRAYQEEIYRYSGEPFNINSTKALGQILFEKLGLPAGKKTKTGYSTNVDVLEKLKDKHPIIRQIMDYRMLTKLQSTYADGLLKVICPDGRIRTTFQNTVTATGRLSSTDPNLQNIPIRTELGSEIRKMFVTEPGWLLVDADYSQIELRVLAHMADDRNMQEAFRSHTDIHTITAAQVFNVPVDQVTPQMRRSAKAVNFGIVYGISEFSLSEDIGVSRMEAKEYIDSYLDRYPGVKRYMHQVVEDAMETGYVTTLYGRRRYLPELKDSKYMVREGAKRMAMNTPIQGTAADIIKIAMVRVARALEAAELQARLILQVHDELIVECPAYEAPLVMQIVTREMQETAELTVPLVAEAHMGSSWYEAK